MKTTSRSICAVVLLLVVTACDINITGPTIDNTNTNTNTIEIHDIGAFTPSPTPSAPVATPTGGSEVPVNIPANARQIAEAVPQSYITKSCEDTYGASSWTYLDSVILALRKSDTRWGYLIKSSGSISHDVIAYRATSDNIGAWAVDIIIDYCGNSKFGWNVVGFDAAAQWTATRF